MIEIHPYGPQWEQAHIAFASKYWTKSRRKIPEYIYWKFRGQPHQILSSFLLAVENNQVVGQLGLLPVNLIVENIIYESQWACDLMVDTSYRGKGVAKLLYDYAHSQKVITIGSDPSPAASRSMQKNGYQLMKASWKCFFSKNLNEVLKLKGVNYKILNYFPNPFLLKYQVLGIFSKNTFQSIDINNFNKIKEAPDPNLFVSVERDSLFIDWRYKSFKNYYLGFEIREDITNNWYSGFYSHSNYYITDLNFKSSTNFNAIICDILKRYKKKGIGMIRFHCNDKKFLKKLTLKGCLKFSTQTVIIYYTNNQLLTEKLITKDFYYTYADSDDNI